MQTFFFTRQAEQIVLPVYVNQQTHTEQYSINKQTDLCEVWTNNYTQTNIINIC